MAEKVKEAEARFSKEKILSSKKYADDKDLIGAILEDGKTYTQTEVDTLIKKYKEGKVI